jgi:ABC-type transport system involved in cytochrome c biogenesis permease subunit
LRFHLPKSHPKAAAKKAKHTAAFLTITGGAAHSIPLLAQYESIIFACAGIVAIYIEEIVTIFHETDE